MDATLPTIRDIVSASNEEERHQLSVQMVAHPNMNLVHVRNQFLELWAQQSGLDEVLENNFTPEGIEAFFVSEFLSRK